MLDGRGATPIRPDDRHDVEPAPLLEQAMLLEEPQRGKRQPALFLGSDGLGGLALTPRLDLDEDQDVAVPGDQVDLAARRPVASEQDPEALSAQVAGGRALAAIAQEPVPEGAHG